MPDLVGNDQYSNRVRQMEPTDLAVPDTWNPIHQVLIDNDVHLETTKASTTVTVTGTGGLTGGGDLSANRTLSIDVGGVTDEHIGNRTILAAAPTGDTGLLGTILNWIASQLAAIIGGAATWRTAPPTTLTDAKTHMDATGAGTHGSTAAATPSTLMHRDVNGRSKVAAPSASDDIARKDTVDAAQTAVQTNLNTHTGATAAGVHGSTAAATANTVMHRDAAGRSKVTAPAASGDVARIDEVWGAIEEALVVPAALPVEGQEPTQVQTAMGPAIEFANGATQAVVFDRRWPFTGTALGMEIVAAMDVAAAGNVRLQVGWQVGGGAVTNGGVTVVTLANTAAEVVVDLGQIIAAASVPQGSLVTITLSRLGADALDTHAGALRLYSMRLKRGL